MLLCAIYHWQQCVCSGGPSISLFSFPLLLYFVIATHPFDVTAFRRYQHVVRQSFTSHSLWRWKQSHVTLWRVFKNCSFIAVVNWTPNGKKNQEKKDRCLFPTSESEARRRAVFPQDGNHAVFLHCSFRAVCLLSAWLFEHSMLSMRRTRRRRHPFMRHFRQSANVAPIWSWMPYVTGPPVRQNYYPLWRRIWAKWSQRMRSSWECLSGTQPDGMRTRWWHGPNCLLPLWHWFV